MSFTTKFLVKNITLFFLIRAVSAARERHAKALVYDNEDAAVYANDFQYNYAYATGDTSRNERKLADGSVEGTYTYIDPVGELQVSYAHCDVLVTFRSERQLSKNSQKSLKNLNSFF